MNTNWLRSITLNFTKFFRWTFIRWLGLSLRSCSDSRNVNLINTKINLFEQYLSLWQPKILIYLLFNFYLHKIVNGWSSLTRKTWNFSKSLNVSTEKRGLHAFSFYNSNFIVDSFLFLLNLSHLVFISSSTFSWFASWRPIGRTPLFTAAFDWIDRSIRDQSPIECFQIRESDTWCIINANFLAVWLTLHLSAWN